MTMADAKSKLSPPNVSDLLTKSTENMRVHRLDRTHLVIDLKAPNFVSQTMIRMNIISPTVNK